MLPDQHMAALDRQARAQGFPSYDAMIAFRRSQHESRMGNGPAHDYNMQDLSSAFDWHPAHLLNYVKDRFNQAVGNH